MAYVAPAIKAVMQKYGVKGSIAVRHHSALVVNIKSGSLDLLDEKCKDRGYEDVNVYWVEQWKTGKIKEFYIELLKAMKGDSWFDKSDISTGYFHIAYYLDINVGKWDKPYVLTA